MRGLPRKHCTSLYDFWLGYIGRGTGPCERGAIVPFEHRLKGDLLEAGHPVVLQKRARHVQFRKIFNFIPNGETSLLSVDSLNLVSLCNLHIELLMLWHQILFF